MNERTDKRTNKRTNERTKERTKERRNKRRNERKKTHLSFLAGFFLVEFLKGGIDFGEGGAVGWVEDFLLHLPGTSFLQRLGKELVGRLEADVVSATGILPMGWNLHGVVVKMVVV